MTTPQTIHQTCPISEMILTIIHLIVVFALCIILICCIYQFIANMAKEKISKTGKILGICFLCVTAIALPMNHIYNAGICYQIPSNIVTILHWLYLSFFTMQLYLLLIIFFQRLSKVFSNTKYRLSVCITRFYNIFWIFYIVMVLSMWSISFMFGMQKNMVWKLIGSIGGMLLLVIIMISLLILYILKLIQVYKSMEFNNNQFLVHAITKTTLLTSASISITFLDAGILGISSAHSQNVAIQWVQTYVTLLNIYTNFLCVILYYQQFKSLYSTFCSCFDEKCSRCWMKLVGNMDDVNMLQKEIAMEVKKKHEMEMNNHKSISCHVTIPSTTDIHTLEAQNGNISNTKSNNDQNPNTPLSVIDL